MKLEDQLTSLELSKKLKELGVEQKSVFYWQPKGLELGKWVVKESGWKNKPEGVYDVSAFTVAELGEMLPHYLMERKDGRAWDCALTITKIQGKPNVSWEVWYITKHSLPKINGKTEANARAKMLIYLIENKLIKLKENQ